MIGILDSGVGGLGIFLEIRKLLPSVDIIYYADSANFPYGEKSEAELEVITKAAVSRLVSEGATTIVIACNSATVSTIGFLRASFPGIQFVGIEPAIKVAAECDGDEIGLMATARTVMSLPSHLSSRASKEARLRVEGSLSNIPKRFLQQAIGREPELTAQAESGRNDKKIFTHTDAELISTIENDYDRITDGYLGQKFQVFEGRGIRSVVLGCTHFYFIQEHLALIYPDITFIEPAESVARRVVEVSGEKSGSKREIFYVTGDKVKFAEFVSKVAGIKDADIRKITALSP